ncbi:hypothetical protein [Lachnoclostridium sp. Marseille-P6806]|uniref:hypothetical protein n=1 Tax=Lachnoclostridium sp. Marseille-P6806 TaxID=2364793 RepID=UPI001031E04E|nr:hypothetical protein [Lachnoclostridium sp. Marseille-P6806]
MQLTFILEKHTAADVVNTPDKIEASLGKNLFSACFPMILADNGHEFTDISGMERSLFGGQRTNVFFCEPNRSDEKGECENNHKLLRSVIPKVSSLACVAQSDMTRLTNHVNSYARKSLFGKCPYELAMTVLPEDFFLLLGLKRIAGNEVMLTPELVKHR